MKIPLQLILSGILAISACAEFRAWTRNDGKTAELELVSVSGEADSKTGQFKMRNGKSVTITASTLSPADATLLNEWTPASSKSTAPASTSAAVSVYDEILDGNLVSLQGKSLASQRDWVKPTKYYLFYHTASWCPPCQKFTPSLVDFYNLKKPRDAEFEVILITHDQDEDAIKEYTLEKQMTFPQLKLSKIEKFNKAFPHPGRGIPNLVLTDPQGTILKTSYEGDKYLGPGVVMNHLGTLLKK